MLKNSSIIHYSPRFLNEQTKSGHLLTLPEPDNQIASLVKIELLHYLMLEVKPCGLGSRIRDMEADLIYW